MSGDGIIHSFQQRRQLEDAFAALGQTNSQAELNQAVKVATKRPIGTAGGWGWRSIDDSDVLDLEAATLAAYGARQRPPLKTTRKVRVMI